jgi:hypothetical protein
MKLIAIAVILVAVTILWLLAHIMYKPIFDKVTQNFIIDKAGIELANICIMIMLLLTFLLGTWI